MPARGAAFAPRARVFRIAIACALLAGCGETLTSPDLPACAHLRDGHWDSRLIVPGAAGIDAHVSSIVRLSDGRVVAGGKFTTMSGVSAVNVAAWDGTRWNALGEGLAGVVTSLAVDDDGTLWAAGNSGVLDKLDPSPSSFLARWDGDRWTFLLQGIYGINGVAAVQGGIAVFGAFFPQQGLPANGIAVWRNGAWIGTLTASSSTTITAVARDGQGLCAAGQFQTNVGGGHNGVACWNGAVWTLIGQSNLGIPTALVRGPDDAWYAGGSFTLSDGDADRYGIARFDTNDSQWHAFEGGVHPHQVVEGGGDAWSPSVAAIAVDGDGLVVAGHFEYVGVPKMRAFNLARWSPTSGWAAMTPPTDLFGQLSSVLPVDGGAYVGGPFTRIGIGAGAGIASVDGTEVHSLPVTTLLPPRSGPVYDVAATPEGIVLAGRFASPTDESAANRRELVRFDGTWSELPDLPDIFDRVLVRALPDGGLAVRSGPTVYRRYGDGPWTQITNETSIGPMVVDGDGALYFLVDTAPYTTIVRSTRNDTSFYAHAPGGVNAMTIHDGALVVSSSTPTFQGDMVFRRSGDDWVLIGSWPEHTSEMVSSPGVGLVAVTPTETHVWNGDAWRTLAAGGIDVAACSDGVVGAIDDGKGARLAFLGDASSDWQMLGEPNGATWWQLVPTENGIYAASNYVSAFGVEDDANVSFTRWALDENSW